MKDNLKPSIEEIRDCLAKNLAVDNICVRWLMGQYEKAERQLADAQATLARLQEYGLVTRDHGDGDANALWNRIDAYRSDPAATLSAEDVRELAEWWAELHTSLSELDDADEPKEPRHITLPEARELAMQAQTDAEKRRAEFAQREADAQTGRESDA